MQAEVEEFFRSIGRDPAGWHKLYPGASSQRIDSLVQRVGRIPAFLNLVAKKSDGAELFIAGLPYVTLFMTSGTPTISSMDWNPEWCVDAFTEKWRERNRGSEAIAFGITNYGGLFLTDSSGRISEWDTAEGRLLEADILPAEWFRRLLVEGRGGWSIYRGGMGNRHDVFSSEFSGRD